MTKLRAFLKARTGAAAVETALVAPLLFVFAFLSIDLGIAEAQGHALRSALAEAARGVRTGVVQKSADPEQTFRDLLCRGAMEMIDCARIKYDVRSFPTIAAVQYVQPVIGPTGDVANFQFTPGGADTIMGLQAVYIVHVNTPLVADMLDPTGDGIVVRGLSIVRGEPWAM